MKSVATALVAAVALAGSAYAQSFTLNTPNSPVQCVPTQLTWVGGTAPFTLIIQEPDANGTPVQIYQGITGSPFSWSTNITGGTFIGMTLRDSTGASAQTASFEIQPGPDNTCLAGVAPPPPGSSSSSSSASVPVTSPGVTSGSSSSSALSTPSTPTTPTSSPGASSASHPASSTSSSASKSGSSSGAPAPSNTGNAALANIAGTGVAGVITALLAIFLA